MWRSYLITICSQFMISDLAKLVSDFVAPLSFPPIHHHPVFFSYAQEKSVLRSNHRGSHRANELRLHKLTSILWCLDDMNAVFWDGTSVHFGFYWISWRTSHLQWYVDPVQCLPDAIETAYTLPACWRWWDTAIWHEDQFYLEKETGHFEPEPCYQSSSWFRLEFVKQ